MKKVFLAAVVCLMSMIATAQEPLRLTIGKHDVTITGEKINAIEMRDKGSETKMTLANYFDITEEWIHFYTIVSNGDKAHTVYHTKISSKTKLTAEMKEEQSETFMEGVAYAVQIKCPEGVNCAIQVTYSDVQDETDVMKDEHLKLVFDNKEFAEKFAAAFNM